MIVIVHKSCPALTVAPSSKSLLLRTPFTGEGTGTDVLKIFIKMAVFKKNDMKQVCKTSVFILNKIE